MPTLHTLKCLPEYFQQTWDGNKLFEIRKNDRNFQVGDKVKLIEWDIAKFTASGRAITSKIVSVIDYPIGLQPGYVVLGLDCEMLICRDG